MSCISPITNYHYLLITCCKMQGLSERQGYRMSVHNEVRMVCAFNCVKKHRTFTSFLFLINLYTICVVIEEVYAYDYEFRRSIASCK